MIHRPDSSLYRTAEQIVRRMQEAGHKTLFAGGCVRDLLLGRTPKDYDIVTSASPEQVQALFRRSRPIGSAFGVVLVVEGRYSYEVATFRADGAYSNGRRPDGVVFTGIREDASRRDFTMNGMYWDPVSDETIDLVGGRRDLRAALVRTIGDPHERLREDYLRIMRAVRFAGRFGFRIEEKTGRAIRELAGLVEQIAPERVHQELRIMLTDARPALCLRMMDELGVLGHVLPELEGARGCEQPENYHPEGDVFVHSILTVEKLGPNPDFVLAMAALLHDVGKPEASRRSGPKQFPEHERIGCDVARAICRRLRLPNNETDRICWLVHRHMYFKDARKMKQSTLKTLFADPGFDQLAELHRADALASWGNLDDYDYVLEKRRSLPPESIDPPPLINGRDLIARGYRPGPSFRRILDAVREMQLQGEISTPQEALSQAGRIAREINAPRR